jgi:hypothetical protein
MAAALVAAACGAAPDVDTGNPSAGRDPSVGGEVACSVIGSIRFPVQHLAGPELAPDEFAAGEIGRTFESFFIGGEGSPEGGSYREAEGFTIVSDGLVLGYTDGRPNAFFEIAGDGVGGWGSCHPNLVEGDLVAYRWRPVSPVDRGLTTLPIEVEGGGCVTDSGTDITTEVASVEVVEEDEQVTLIAWVRDDRAQEMCAGVGLMVAATAELDSPLGDRILVDGGTVPSAAPAP